MTATVLSPNGSPDRMTEEGAARLDALVRQVRDLPALPDAALRVMKLSEDPRAGAADIARALSTDQALTARILKLANSAFYGASRRVSTVTEAVVMLGMRTVRNMTVAIGCQPFLEKPLDGYALPAGDLWKHSLCCGFAAQALAKRSGYRAAEEAFVAGLLHDIGKVVLNLYLTKLFATVVGRAETQHMAFMDAERSVLGFDHAQAGARVLEKWNLPPVLVSAVRGHHAPLSELPVPAPLTALVHVADVVCLLLGRRPGRGRFAIPVAGGRAGVSAPDGRRRGMRRRRSQRSLRPLRPVIRRVIIRQARTASPTRCVR